MKRALLVVVLAVSFLVSACGAGGAAPTDGEVAALTESTPPVGETVDFFFYTHCGVESARIGGRWWHATEPLYGKAGEGVGPPDGWDDPYQSGKLTVLSSKRAVFETHDVRVVLSPSATGKPVRICR